MRQVGKDERGFILVLALVTMLAMTIIGLSVIMNMTTDMQLPVTSGRRDGVPAPPRPARGHVEFRLASGNARHIGEDLRMQATGTWATWNRTAPGLQSGTATPTGERGQP
ncbi:MAG: hypothetical protein HS130_10950 [Deltaproteobacteria bacterium]|nr:hypothetical protein [Deltaproteobacteria bacterium]